MSDHMMPSTRRPGKAEVAAHAAQVANLTTSDVSIVVNPLDPAEVFVEPNTCTDLPSVRHLLPAEWQAAPLHRFEPAVGRFGAWVLRRDTPRQHRPRVWGQDTHWCDCSACDTFRAVRLSLVLIEEA